MTRTNIVDTTKVDSIVMPWQVTTHNLKKFNQSNFALQVKSNYYGMDVAR
jgi:hypothetical protein